MGECAYGSGKAHPAARLAPAATNNRAGAGPAPITPSTREAGQGINLLGTEDLVARIAQTRHDVAFLIESLINGGTIELDVGMGCFQCL